MVKCNIERLKTVESDFIAISDMNTSTQCEQNLSNADMLDFRSDMDNRSFYEKTAWNACKDLIYTKNEETLWQCIVGEIKTPKGVLSNSIGQSSYGCLIWDFIGENLDSLDIKEIEYEIIQVCLKYPEVNNVIGIEAYTADNTMLLVEISIDSIYGTFDGTLRIPTAHISKKDWRKYDNRILN